MTDQTTPEPLTDDRYSLDEIRTYLDGPPVVADHRHHRDVDRMAWLLDEVDRLRAKLEEARQAAGAEHGRAAALEAAYREASTGRDARDAEIERLTAARDQAREGRDRADQQIRYHLDVARAAERERDQARAERDALDAKINGDGVISCTGCGRCSVCRRRGITAYSVLGLDPAETDTRDKYEQQPGAENFGGRGRRAGRGSAGHG